MKILEWEIHRILHPNIEHDYTAYCSARKLNVSEEIDPYYRNAICYSEGLAGHIRNCHDVFVSNDRNFLKSKKKILLVALGAGEILSPDEACDRIKNNIPFASPSDAHLRAEGPRTEWLIPEEFVQYKKFFLSGSNLDAPF